LAVWSIFCGGYRLMAQRPQFLALAIKGVVDADGQLLVADPQLRRLHVDCGGVDGGTLAIPGLLDLAKLAWATGGKLERPVYVADGQHDLELWVEAERQEKTVALSILGWHENGNRAITRLPRPTFALGEPAAQKKYDVLLNPGGIVVRLADDWNKTLGTDLVGKSVSAAFELKAEGGTWDGVWASAEDRIDVAVVERLSKRSLLFSAEAAILADGSRIGWHCRLRAANSNDRPMLDGASDRASSPSGAVFGRQFASAVRQPLSRIIANAETIGSQLNGPLKDNYAGYAQDIASAARHLAELVSDLEDLDAIERPDFKIARENIELGDIARRVAGLLALKASDHQIELLLPAKELSAHAVGEFRRVLQVVLNLVGNAIRYSPDGSQIRITIDPDQPSISVSDQGAGVPEDDRERVFEKFERLGRSGDGGSGLGLYISRKLARAMRGDLTVTEAPEGGACFTFRLPAA
jgi:signal transduction histidine kinase